MSLKPRLLVTAAIIEKDSLLFCARRGPDRHLAGYWEFPGGKVELGESAANGLARELQEELNVDVQVNNLFAVNIHEYDHNIVELHAYWVEILAGTLSLKDHDDFIWLPIEKLNSLMWAPADIPFIEKLMSFPTLHARKHD